MKFEDYLAKETEDFIATMNASLDVWAIEEEKILEEK